MSHPKSTRSSCGCSTATRTRARPLKTFRGLWADCAACREAGRAPRTHAKSPYRTRPRVPRESTRWRKVELPQELCEPRVGAEAVEQRVYADVRQSAETVGDGFAEEGERFLLIAEPRVDDSELLRRDVRVARL